MISPVTSVTSSVISPCLPVISPVTSVTSPGELPEGSIMFTIVYILFTENLDGPTAGTRVRDAQP